jgi:diacylglycerol kinase
MGAPSQQNNTADTADTADRRSAIPRSGFWRSFAFAGQGVWHVVRTQRNMRVHLTAAAAVIALAVILRVTAVDWACLLAVIGLVLTAETLNTVVEAVVDLYTDEFHPLAKIAKDVAAAAVLISCVAAVGVGIAVFLPRLLRSAG